MGRPFCVRPPTACCKLRTSALNDVHLLKSSIFMNMKRQRANIACDKCRLLKAKVGRPSLHFIFPVLKFAGAVRRAAANLR